MTRYSKAIQAYGGKCHKCGSGVNLSFKWLIPYTKVTKTQFTALLLSEKKAGRNSFGLYCSTCKANAGDGFPTEARANTIYSRALKARRSPTRAETAMRKIVYLQAGNTIRNHFETQTVFPPHYYVDFCDKKCKLIVEVDGKEHFNKDGSRTESDLKRQAFIEAKGYTFLRFTNKEVTDNADAVKEKLLTVHNSMMEPTV